MDGLDVHCFARGTLITMADGSQKAIEDLAVGDDVASRNAAGQPIDARIEELAAPMHSDLVAITFVNGTSLTCTQDHPILGADNRWYALDPDKTMTDYAFDKVYPLTPGLEVASQSTTAGLKIVAINPIHEPQQTFTIVSLDQSNVFMANGVWVGTEELRGAGVDVMKECLAEEQ